MILLLDNLLSIHQSTFEVFSYSLHIYPHAQKVFAKMYIFVLSFHMQRKLFLLLLNLDQQTDKQLQHYSRLILVEVFQALLKQLVLTLCPFVCFLWQKLNLFFYLHIAPQPLHFHLQELRLDQQTHHLLYPKPL